MLWIVSGAIGSGKTLCMAWFAHLFYSLGRSIYANFNLKLPFTRLDAGSDFMSISTPNNAIFLDEWWLNSDSRSSNSQTNIMTSRWTLQSRKIGAGITDVFMSAQSPDQLDKRIRANAMVHLMPEVVEVDKRGVPSLMKVHMVALRASRVIDKTFNLPLQFPFDGKTVVDVPESYDTYEAMNGGDFGGLSLHKAKIEKYLDWDGDVQDLAYLLQYKEGISSRQQCKDIASLISRKSPLLANI